MNASLQSKINDLANNGYDFDGSKYISMAWENFKKVPGMYIGYLFLFLAISTLLGVIPYSIGDLITPIFGVGFALFAADIQQNKEGDFSRFFDGFKSKPLHLVLVALISILGIGVFFIPLLAYLGFGEVFDLFSGSSMDFDLFSDINSGMAVGLGFLCAIPAIYLGIAWSWASFFVVFKGLDFWPAMEASRRIISKRWWSYLGFSFLLGLIVLAGALCLFVGLVVAIPVVTIAPYIAFEQIVGLDDHEIDIIDHLIDDDM